MFYNTGVVIEGGGSGREEMGGEVLGEMGKGGRDNSEKGSRKGERKEVYSCMYIQCKRVEEGRQRGKWEGRKTVVGIWM